ncbi:MAG: helix-turn-helix domain-containing protein [Thermoleophilia bacterium]
MKDPQNAVAEARVIDALELRAGEIARAMLERSHAEVPEYAAHSDPGFVEAALAHCADHVEAFLTVARRRGPLDNEELEFVRTQAVMRARQGVPLEALLHVYRAGHRAVFRAIVEAAEATRQGAEAALALTDRTLGHIDVITTTFTESYLATRHEMEAGADAARRALLDRALAGALEPGPESDHRARALGVDPDAPYVVVTCRRSAPGTDAEGLAALAGRLGRIDLSDGRAAVAVVRDQEVVTVLPVGDRSAGEIHAVLARALGGGHRAGVSLPCRGLGELARGHSEARTVLRSGSADEVASLLGMSAAEYLMATADDTARRLLDPRIRAALEGDGGITLAVTLLAFLDADLSAPGAADALGVHPNTVYYRLDKLARTTGRNPRRFGDLVELLVAVRLLDASPDGRAAASPRGVPQRRPRRRTGVS